MANAVLKFPSVDALRAALSLLPPDVSAAGGTVHEGDDGSLVVSAPLPAAVRKTLVEAGAEALRSAPKGGRPFAHWTELIPLVPDPEFDLRDVLFVLPPNEPWLPLAGELVRLGCDAVDVARLDRDDWVLRTRRPPFYTVARAATGHWTAFWRQGPVYAPVGFRHPLADQLPTPEADTLVLMGRDGLRVVRPGGWTELLQRMELVLPPPIEVPVTPPTERLTVRLRLRPAPRAATPMLWRIDAADGRSVDAVLDQLLAVLPESVTDRLSFARFTLPDGTDGALLRARPGTVPPALEGLEPYTPHPQLPAVHVPAGRTIDPPLHARTLAALLDPPLGDLAWLEVDRSRPDDGGIVVHRVSESAFQPLSDWILYHADRDAARVQAWLGSAVFDWAPLDLPIARDEKSPEPRQEAPRAARAAPATFDRPAAPTVEVVTVAPTPTVQVAVAPVVTESNDVERALQTLQAQVKADPARDDLWVPMAELHHALGQHREASLCWSRALWDQPAELRQRLAAQWLALLPRGLGQLTADPGTVEMTAVVARALAQPDAFEPPALQRWLEAHDRPLDVRSRWMVRRRAAELAGGDTLALARGRDEVLGSIRAGLAPWRDVPAFLRTSTTEEERRWLGSSLAGMMGKLEPLIPGEAPKHCTRAYAALIIAWAQACLGLDAPVREALAAAEQALPLSDAIHRVLLGLYRSGIEEALHGLPAETPPPPEVTAELDALEAFDRYKVQRLQDQSVAVLAQAGAADAFSNWVRRETRATFAGMPPDQLLPAIRAALDRLGDNPGPTLLEILGAAAGLDEAHGLGVLERVVKVGIPLPAEPRISVLVEATSLAAALNRPEVLEQSGAIDALQQALVAQVREKPKAIVDPARDLARSLARCRLALPGIALFSAVRAAVPATESTVRLRLSSALAQLGGDVGNEAQEALKLLANPQLPRTERLGIVAATADLATPLPVDQAVALWNALVPQAAIADAFSTNTHFALSFLQVVEALAAAHVHPDRLLGPEGRARIEADEHRVRQRIHREERL